jgi:hypothetical protein
MNGIVEGQTYAIASRLAAVGCHTDLAFRSKTRSTPGSEYAIAIAIEAGISSQPERMLLDWNSRYFCVFEGSRIYDCPAISPPISQFLNPLLLNAEFKS